MPATQSSESVEELKNDATRALRSADSSDQLEAWRVEYLGRKSRLTLILRGLGSLDIEQRKVVGASANQLRVELESLFDERLQQAKSSRAPAGSIDVTLPGRKSVPGGLHPSTQLIRELTQAFNELGFPPVGVPGSERGR